jgi:surfactin synthase thioesterase subunit
MPVIALGGDADMVTPPETLATWCEEALDFRGLHLFPGGHFFLAEHAVAVADLVIRTACSPDRPREAVRELPTPPR